MQDNSIALKEWQTAKSERECFRAMEYDLEKYPLPICFDPDEEQAQLYGRHCRIGEIAKRYYQRFLKPLNNG